MLKTIRQKGPSFLLFGGFFLLLPLILSLANYEPDRPIKWFVFVLLMGIAGIFTLLNKQDASFKLPKGLVFPLLAWVIITLISIGFASNLLEAVFESARWLLLFGFFLFSVWVLRSRDPEFRTLSSVISILLIITSLLGWIQYLDPKMIELPPGGRAPYGTFNNVNFFATAVMLMLPFAAFTLTEFGKKSFYIGLIAIIGGISVIALTQTDAVYLSLGVAACILFILLPHEYFRTKQGENRLPFYKKWVFRFLLILSLVTVGLFWTVKTQKFGQFGSMMVTAWDEGGKGINSRSNSAEERIILWRHSVDMFKERPVTGWGSGNWKMVIGKYGVKGFYEGYGTRFYLHAHNDYVEALAEKGLLGLLALLSVFGFTAGFQLRIFFQGTSRRERLIALSLFAGWMALATESFFNFSLEQVFHPVMMMTLMAVTVVLYLRTYPTQKKANWLFPTQLVIGTIAIVLIFPSWKRVEGDQHMYRLTVAQLSHNWPKMLKEAKLAENPFFELDPMAATPMSWYQGVAYFYQNDFNAALPAFEKAYSINPWHVQVMQNYGSALIKTNQLDAGITMYEKTLSLYPDFDECRKNLCEVYKALKKYPQLRSTVTYWKDKTPGMGLNVYYRNTISLLDSLQIERSGH